MVGNRLISAGQGGGGMPQPTGMTYSHTIPAVYISQLYRVGTPSRHEGVTWDADREQLVLIGNNGTYNWLYVIDYPSATYLRSIEGGPYYTEPTYDGTNYHAPYAIQAQKYNPDTMASAGGYFVYPNSAAGSLRVQYLQGLGMYENSSGSPRIWYAHTYQPYQGITGCLGSDGSGTGAITFSTSTFYQGGTWDLYDKFWICDGTSTIRQKYSNWNNTGLTVNSGFSDCRSIAYMESQQQFAVVGMDNGTIRIFNATY